MMARRTLLITYFATYLVAIGTIIRYLTSFSDDSLWSIALPLGIYLVLLFAEPIFIRRNRYLIYFYLLVQTTIICGISFITPNVDFWAALFLPLVLQAMQNLPRRNGFIVTGLLTVTMAIFMLLGIGPEIGLPLILINGVIYFFLATFITILGEAESSNNQLQEAHKQLQVYTTQAEEVAVLKERNRLARELHDSVTQSLYSLTLFTEAARHMAEDLGETSIEQYIAQIGVMGQQALKEMRLLVYELQPPELEREGLVRTLRKRMEAVEGRAGVETRLEVDEFVELPGDIEGDLYRIVQEALNNSLKHASAGSVVVYLRQSNGSIELEIVDDGIGFRPESSTDNGGMGLKSMRERAENIGGSVTIRSGPGEGTSLKVSIPIIRTDDQRSEAGFKS